MRAKMEMALEEEVEDGAVEEEGAADAEPPPIRGELELPPFRCDKCACNR
jgi:hypothetical protein